MLTGLLRASLCPGSCGHGPVSSAKLHGLCHMRLGETLPEVHGLLNLLEEVGFEPS